MARTLAVRTLRELAATEGLSTRAAALLLLAHARTGRLTPALLTKLQLACDARGRSATDDDGLPSAGTLARWHNAERKGQGLAPRAGAVIDLRPRAWHRVFFALTDRPQKPTLRDSHDKLLAAWLPVWGPKPSYMAAVRLYAKRSGTDRLKGRHTGSALRAKTFFHKRTYADMAPFTEVHADGWTTHFTAPHPVSGEFKTFEVWHFHDVATRYVTPMAVGESENPEVILKGLQECIRVGGVPAIWQTDHTSSVKNHAVMDEHAGLADRLGISVVHPQTVGNSQANGIAENFNTWLDREARELATYQHPQRMDSGTFVRVRRITNAMVKAADKPAERERLRQLAMRMGKGIVFDSRAEALAWIAERQHRWNNKPHRELPKIRCPETGRWTHMTPQQSLDAALAAGWEPVRLTEAVLIDEFRKHYQLRVTRGTVTPYNGQRYHHSELAHLEGSDVLVAVDHDRPESVWIKDLQGRFIVEASLVAAVRGRTESMREHSERKRAEAQIRRREQQIEAISARIQPAALELNASPTLDLPLPVPPRPAREPEPVPQIAPPRPAALRERDEPLTYSDSLERLAAMERAASARRAAEAAQPFPSTPTSTPTEEKEQAQS